MDFQKILKIKGLKYWVAVGAFLLVIFFFEQNNVIDVFRLHRQVSQLDDSIASLQKANTEDSIKNANLDNLESLERYGREKYWMKRENEDIFVIKECER